MPLVDRTFAISERATELMTRHCEKASPRGYELWFTFVAANDEQLMGKLRSVVEQHTKLTETDVDELFERHLLPRRIGGDVEEAGRGVIVEIEKVVGFIDTALGSARRYDTSLRELSVEIDGVGESALHAVLGSLVTATRDVAENNALLERRLRESRGEIDKLRETLEAVRLETLVDPLTGIANRRSFEATLASRVETAWHDGSGLSLVVIDIDEFKRFNDLYGHLTGDQVLRLVSAAMGENVDPGAAIARFGGEEFAIILPGAERAAALACAERIRANVESRELRKRSTGESLGRITLSLGVALLRTGESAISLLERADTCLYRAKRTGRNRAVSDDDPSLPGLSNAA